jgi:anaphase-promoting complex subunit 2
MERVFAAVLDLNHDAFQQSSAPFASSRSAELIGKLILTSIRRSCQQILAELPATDISAAAVAFMLKFHHLFDAAIRFDGALSAHIQSILRSILLLRFPDGLHEFPCDIGSLATLDAQAYDAFSFCGLMPHLKRLIVEQIRKECFAAITSFKENYEESALSASLDRLSQLMAVFGDRFPDLGREKRCLKLDIHRFVVQTRADAIFDIVTAFPDSKPALIDLKQSCGRTSSHREVAETTLRIFVARLLHLGASTSDIVTQYINAIQALNIVDESGGLTRAVSPPIQQYLTTRTDLLDTIVNRILEDDTLVASTISAQKPNDDDILRDADVQRELDFGWSPEPMHSHIRDLQSLVRDASDSDALALLLNVYGSISSFVSQLEKEIARRVETEGGFTFDNEMRAVELLKRRFGSQSFLNCEVILRDVADSKRLATMAESCIVQPLVVSHLYWPDLPSDFLRVPEEVQAEIDRYSEEFERLKHPRKLKWVPTAGAVQIELNFDDGEAMELTVSPVAASVALLMNQEDEIDADMICERLEVSRWAADMTLLYWTQSNIFIKDGRRYRISPTKPATIAPANVSETENESGTGAEEEEEVEPHVKDAMTFGNFVKTILMNRQKEKITVRKLYELMQKFIVYPKFTRTYEQYLKILRVYVDQGKVSVQDDIVQLVKT